MFDLGPLGLGSGYSSGNDTNDSGVVTGSYSVSSPIGDTSHAYLWDAVNGVTDIGTLGGLSSVGVAINDVGRVAGDSAILRDPFSGPTHAFVWDASSGMSDLGTLGEASVSSHAAGINDAGRVVGWSEIGADLESRAFLWDPVDGMLSLQELVADFSGWEYLERATDISDTGYSTGYGRTAEGFRRAFLMVPGVNAVPTSSPISLVALGLSWIGFRAFRATQ